MGTYLEFDDKTGMYKSITQEQWLKKIETEVHSLTAEDIKKFSEDLRKNRMIDERTEIKDKLLDIFQKHYCMICGSQRCVGDLRDGCSYYRSYIDKIKEVYDEMKGEVE